MDCVLPYGLLLAQPLRMLSIHRLSRIWKKWHELQEKIEVTSYKELKKCFEVAARCHVFGS